MRPDSGYSLPVVDAAGERIGDVGHGNRKDIRNAVEAAHKASGWARATAHQRAQVLYYIAENLAARAEELGRLVSGDEVEQAIGRLLEFDLLVGKAVTTPGSLPESSGSVVLPATYVVFTGIASRNTASTASSLPMFRTVSV